MVLSLHKSELHSLLVYSNHYRTGRKLDLLQMALALVDHDTPLHIQMKIIELYGRRFVANLPPVIKADPGKTLTEYDAMLGVGSHFDRRRCPAVSPTRLQLSSSISSASLVPTHPNVKFTTLPFYDVLAELLTPSSLVPSEPSVMQSSYFTFSLTPYQAQDIAVSRLYSCKLFAAINSEQSTCGWLTQLRFCSLDTSRLQADYFPPNITIKVNGKVATLPGLLPAQKPGAEPRRLSQPINITPLCNTVSSLINHITVLWTYVTGRCYCVGVNLVKKVNADVLLQRLKNNAVQHPDDTWALIQRKLNVDAESDVIATSLRVSLLCPIGKTRMTYACRANTCSHLQCFDAAIYLQMNERKSTWTCPICDDPAEYSTLILDGLFANIIHREPDGDEVEFTTDAGWRVIGRTKDATGSEGSMDRRTCVEVNDVGAACRDSCITSASTSVAADSESSRPIVCDDVIDLTETSDDDDNNDDVGACRTSLPTPPCVEDYVLMPDKRAWSPLSVGQPSVTFSTPPLCSASPLPRWSTASRNIDLVTPVADRVLDIFPQSHCSSTISRDSDLSHSQLFQQQQLSFTIHHSPHYQQEQQPPTAHSTLPIHHSLRGASPSSSSHTSSRQKNKSPAANRLHPYSTSSHSSAFQTASFDPYTSALQRDFFSSLLSSHSLMQTQYQPMMMNYLSPLTNSSHYSSPLLFPDDLFGAADYSILGASGVGLGAGAKGNSFTDCFSGLDQMQPTDLTITGQLHHRASATSTASSTLSLDNLYSFPTWRPSDHDSSSLGRLHSPDTSGCNSGLW